MIRASYPIVFLLTWCHTALGNVDLKDFYPYGSFEGDAVLPRGWNIVSGPITLVQPFPFNAVPQKTMWISNGGYISFLATTAYVPGNPPCDKTASVVAPFKVPVDTNTAGTVYYRQSQDINLLSKAATTISAAYGIANIKLTNLFIATWVGVSFHGFTGAGGSAPQNTFQAILTTDGKYSFAIFNYHSITWTQGDFLAKCGGSPATGVGGNCQAEIGFTIANLKSSYLDGSCGNGALTIAQRSNAGNVGGIWVMRFDNDPNSPISQTKPGFVDMMGHNPVEATLPNPFNVASKVSCIFSDQKVPTAFVSAQAAWIPATKTRANITNRVSCMPPFFLSFGDYNYVVNIVGLAGNFSYHGTVVVHTPEPHVSLTVVNASLATYRVELNVTWDGDMLPGSGSPQASISMYVWNNFQRFWGPKIVLAPAVNNTGKATVVLVQPNAAIFLTDHIIISVGATTTGATIFSPMFIFDEDNVKIFKEILPRKKNKYSYQLAPLKLQRKSRYQRKYKSVNSNSNSKSTPKSVARVFDGSKANPSIWQTVSMLGHTQLKVPFVIKANYTTIRCSFQDPLRGSLVVSAAVSVDKLHADCYVPFLYSYGVIHLTAAGTTGGNVSVVSDQLFLDVLPPVPQVNVQQQSALGGAEKFALKLKISWDPTLVPSTYPYLNAYAFAFDEGLQTWQDSVLVNAQQVHPNASTIVLPMSDIAMTTFFDNKVIFGLCYITSDSQWCVFSKIFYQQVVPTKELR